MVMRKRFFEAAKACSYESDYKGATSVRIGAVAVFRGSIIAKGCNRNKTHPLQERYNKYRYRDNTNSYHPSKVHAEMEIVSKIRYLDLDFSDVVIYVYRELKNGQKALAKPCPACEAAIRALGIKQIYYTTQNGYISETFD